MSRKKHQEPFCSFCGKNKNEARKLIAGVDAYICDECVSVATEIIIDSLSDTDLEVFETEETPLPKPSKIKEELDKYIIGQDPAKKIISVAVYNHYKRIFRANKEDDDVEIQKSNVLLVGPTGSGKTLIAQTLAKIIEVPFAIADATSLTEAGYVGEDVENILLKLIQAADDDIELAERGIIYIDELDKIRRKSENTSITRDVSGEGVQQSLLKIIEGTEANVPPLGGRKHPHQEFIKIDTSNILFILGGAFDGLEDVIAKRTGEKSLGFGANIKSKKLKDNDEIFKELVSDDLIKFGLIPELVGRMPITATLDNLGEKELVRILTEPKNALVKQYKKLFEYDDVELSFEKQALLEIAKLAKEKKTGARGLRTILEETMVNIMYEIPDEDIKKCTITKSTITKKAKPRLLRNDTKNIKEISAKKPEKVKKEEIVS